MKGILCIVKDAESEDKYFSALSSTDADSESLYIEKCIKEIKSKYNNDETRELCSDQNIEFSVKIINFEITDEEEVFALK